MPPAETTHSKLNQGKACFDDLRPARVTPSRNQFTSANPGYSRDISDFFEPALGQLEVEPDRPPRRFSRFPGCFCIPGTSAGAAKTDPQGLIQRETPIRRNYETLPGFRS